MLDDSYCWSQTHVVNVTRCDPERWFGRKVQTGEEFPKRGTREEKNMCHCKDSQNSYFCPLFYEYANENSVSVRLNPP